MIKAFLRSASGLAIFRAFKAPSPDLAQLTSPVVLRGPRSSGTQERTTTNEAPWIKGQNEERKARLAAMPRYVVGTAHTGEAKCWVVLDRGKADPPGGRENGRYKHATNARRAARRLNAQELAALGAAG